MTEKWVLPWKLPRVEIDGGNAFIFATDIGLLAGEWPEKILTDLGNGHPLVKKMAQWSEVVTDNWKHAQLEGYLYQQDCNGLTIMVYND